MANGTRSTNEIANGQHFAGFAVIENGNGTFGVATEKITASAAIESHIELRALHLTLKRIENLLLNLGHDGIHEVLREHARVIRRAKQKRLQRQRAVRRAKKAASHG